MKLTKKDTINSKLLFLSETFNLELTGEELMRLWDITYSHECGDNHPSNNRFTSVIRDETGLSPNELVGIWKNFKNGKYVPR